jgi:hypothetical protein
VWLEAQQQVPLHPNLFKVITSFAFTTNYIVDNDAGLVTSYYLIVLIIECLAGLNCIIVIASLYYSLAMNHIRELPQFEIRGYYTQVVKDGQNPDNS